MNKENQMIIDIFHKLYYYNSSKQIPQMTYNGVPIQKLPFDMFNYQQIIFDQKPDFIIECGANKGGSTLFFANILDIIGKGKVISIDICEREGVWHETVRKHEKICRLKGSSIDPKIVSNVNEIIKDNRNCFVILDSLHTKQHVLQEMVIYSKFISSGNYLIVEDSNLNGHPLPPEWHKETKNEGGPFEAIIEFLKLRNDFKVDFNLENRFLFTYAPSGYLQKK